MLHPGNIVRQIHGSQKCILVVCGKSLSQIAECAEKQA